MGFSWIKRLFKKKSFTKNSDVDISTIDTSFIKVPKLSDLSKENQDKVMEYFNEIKYENYETIVKYSDSLLEKSNKEIDFFVHDLEDIIKDISSIVNDVNKDTYFKLLLYREEIKLSIEELNIIEQEAELRLIALDTYIKKEERRKYDFLGIFGKAERLRYLGDKSSLLNERQRLLITIKLNKQHLQIIYNTLNENKELLELMNNYINSSKSFNTEYCNYEICEKYAEKLLEEKKFICKDQCNELKDLVNIFYARRDIRCGICYLSSEELKRLNLEYQKIIPFLARETREIKQYAYEHRNDYKIIINEINDVVSKYEKTPSTDWNIKELEKNIEKYESIIDIYRIICKKYITDDILISMVKALLNLNYFVYCLSNKFVSDGLCAYKTISKIELLYNEYWNLDIEDMIVKDAEIKYYYQRALELFKQIEGKYDVKLDFSLVNQFNKDKERLENIDVFRSKCELKYLYDILNGNFDMFCLEIFINTYVDYQDKKEKKVNNLMAFIKRISNGIIIKDDTYDFQDDSLISIDNLFYLLKFLGVKKYNLSELFREAKPFEQKDDIGSWERSKISIKCYQLNELLVKSYLKQLEHEYDDRIFVIPKEIEFHSLLEYQFKHVRYSLKNLNISENTIAIFVTNWGQVNTIHRALEKNEANIKYFIMTEELYNSYKEVYETVNDQREQQIIVVPNDVKYSELSSYLDRELKKEKKEEKIKSKKI